MENNVTKDYGRYGKTMLQKTTDAMENPYYKRLRTRYGKNHGTKDYDRSTESHTIKDYDRSKENHVIKDYGRAMEKTML